MINPSTIHKPSLFPTLTPANDTSNFITTGEVELSNSSKTAKIHVNKNGKRQLIGQVPCKPLRALLNSQSLKDDIYKYQKTNKGEVYARTK